MSQILICTVFTTLALALQSFLVMLSWLSARAKRRLTREIQAASAVACDAENKLELAEAELIEVATERDLLRSMGEEMLKDLEATKTRAERAESALEVAQGGGSVRVQGGNSTSLGGSFSWHL